MVLMLWSGPMKESSAAFNETATLIESRAAENIVIEAAFARPARVG
jgi:hypothetical protein